MRSWLYGVTDLKTGDHYEDLPSGRLIQIISGYTRYKQASNLFAKGKDTHIVGGRFLIVKYQDKAPNSPNSIWAMYPDWCRWFCEEWIAVCERIKAHG